MNIVITGHTSGIGQTIFNYFVEKKHNCIGFSLDTGHDISQKETQEIILEKLEDADVFINNAWHITGQLELLKSVCEQWKSCPEKIIFNISSNIAGHLKADKNSNLINHVGENILLTYTNSKHEQDIFCKEFSYANDNIHLVNLKIGLVDTQSTSSINNKKIMTEDIAKIIDFVLNNQTVKIITMEFIAK